MRSAAAAAPAAFALLAENSDVMDADFMRFGAGAAPPGPELSAPLGAGAGAGADDASGVGAEERDGWRGGGGPEVGTGSVCFTMHANIHANFEFVGFI